MINLLRFVVVNQFFKKSDILYRVCNRITVLLMVAARQYLKLTDKSASLFSIETRYQAGLDTVHRAL